MVKLRVKVGGSYTDLAIVNCNDEFHPIEFDAPEFKGRAVVRIKDFGKGKFNRLSPLWSSSPNLHFMHVRVCMVSGLVSMHAARLQTHAVTLSIPTPFFSQHHIHPPIFIGPGLDMPPPSSTGGEKHRVTATSQG